MPDALDDIRAAMRHHQAGRVAEAEAACRRLLARSPDHPDALHLLGVLALQAGRLDDAVDLLRAAIRARPAFAEAYNNLGVALDGRGQWVKAEWAFRGALNLNARQLDAWKNLGNVLRKQNRPADAAEAFREAVRLAPADAVAHSGLGMASLDLGQLCEAITHYRRASDLQPDSPAAHSDLLFWLLHDPDLAPAELFAEHCRWSERHERPRSGAILPHDNDRDPDRPLRVGYVSPDFREHTVARFIEPVLANHDPARVVSVCYSDVAEPDDVTGRLRSAAAEWRDTAALSDEQLADLVRRDRIDLLVDLSGHMGGNRLRVFARKPAPVQVTYMGYPHSTGLEAMDWRITDGPSDPPGCTEAFHTERLYRIDGCAFAYRPTESPPLTDPPSLSRGHVTFGMLNRTAKVQPGAVALWASVMRAVPDSRLLVLCRGGEENAAVRRLFESAGIEVTRLCLTPTGPRQQYLALAAEVDVNLDPFPYSGMTTTCDFLWMGVPTVTLAGNTAAANAGASLLRAMGLSELIAVTPDEYLQIAADLARDVSKRLELRTNLRTRMNLSPLRDERALTIKMESAYRAMWQEWCEGPTAAGLNTGGPTF